MFRKRRLKRCLKNYILITITIIAFAVYLVSAIALDTNGTNMFYIGTSISSSWLFLFAYANRDRF